MKMAVLLWVSGFFACAAVVDSVAVHTAAWPLDLALCVACAWYAWCLAVDAQRREQ